MSVRKAGHDRYLGFSAAGLALSDGLFGRECEFRALAEMVDRCCWPLLRTTAVSSARC